MLPRGIRNNNPLNIRRNKDQWQGMKKEQTDPSFCQFENLAYGWRAAFRLLTRTYYHTYRLYTIRAIVNKWAPPNENNTRAYVENVSRLTGIAPDEPLGIPSDRPAHWIALGAAMAIPTSSCPRSDGIFGCFRRHIRLVPMILYSPKVSSERLLNAIGTGERNVRNDPKVTAYQFVGNTVVTT